MFIHEDMTGRQIDVGDIVLFTEPGAGRNLPGLCFGEVQGLTRASVRLFYLNKDFSRVQAEVFESETTSYYTSPSGKAYYGYKGTGRYADKTPEAVKIYENRFYIVKKV